MPGFRHTRVLYLHHGFRNETLCTVEPGLFLRKKGEQEVIGEPKRGLKVSRPSYFVRVPSYFEALWYPHLYFDRKSNI